MELPLRELKLNVTYLYRDEDTRELIAAEEIGADDEPHFIRDDRMYECICGTRRCRASQTSVLSVSLFCTLVVAVLIVIVVLFCTVISLSSNVRVLQANESRGEVLGVISWLHYPVGELVVRNHSISHTP